MFLRSRTTALTIVLAALAAPAQAIVIDNMIRSIDVTFTDDNGDVVATQGASSFEVGDTGLTNPLNVLIGGGAGAFEASIGVSGFGRYGMDARLLNGGTLTGNLNFFESVTNNAAFAQDLSVTFIVNEGAAQLVGAENSTLEYQISTGVLPFAAFDSEGTLSGRSDFSADFVETGDSLGADQPVPGGDVEIPFSVQTVDLGRLEAGESLSFFYSARFLIGGPGIVEIANFQLTDPLLPPDQPHFTFSATPAGPQAVPLPPAFLMAAAGFGVLAMVGRRRRQAGGARQQPVM